MIKLKPFKTVKLPQTIRRMDYRPRSTSGFSSYELYLLWRGYPLMPAGTSLEVGHRRRHWEPAYRRWVTRGRFERVDAELARLMFTPRREVLM